MGWRDIWSLKRATRTGLIAGLAAALLWPAYAIWQEPVRPVFAAALVVMAIGGASILVAAASDIATVKRGRNATRARTFDLLLGLVLTLPPLSALPDLLF